MMRRHSSRPRGQSTVEFALIFGVIVLIMVGIFDLGRVVFAYNGVAHAARDAARRGTVDPLDCEAMFLRVQNATIGQDNVVVVVDYEPKQTLSGDGDICPAYDSEATYTDPSSGSLDGTISTSFPQVGGRLTVTVTQDAPLVTPIISRLVGDFIAVSAESAMVITSCGDACPTSLVGTPDLIH